MAKVYDDGDFARAKKTPREAGFARGHVITDRVNRCQLRPSAQMRASRRVDTGLNQTVWRWS
jgi:hypothetical protein